MLSRDTHVRLQHSLGEKDQLQLVLSDTDTYLVLEGTADSILMLVDRINDRVKPLRSTT